MHIKLKHSKLVSYFEYKLVGIMKKINVLTIEYNEDTEQVEYIQEEIIDDKKDVVPVRCIVLEDYFDKDSMTLISDCTEIGES